MTLEHIEVLSTIAIIALLGGLEFTLWYIQHRSEVDDRKLQNKQMEILDGILTELVIANAADVEFKKPQETGNVEESK